VLTGSLAFGGGLYWLSRLSEHGSYLHAILGPTLVAGADLGLLFVPLTVVAMAKVAESESGVAASLRNTGQQVGGSIGLAVLGTVAFTVVANSARAGRGTQSAHHAVPQRVLSDGHVRTMRGPESIMQRHPAQGRPRP